MNTQTAAQKIADTAHNLSVSAAASAKEAVQATRKAANNSLDKAERGVNYVHGELDPAIDDLAARAQDLAARGISYCAETSERARRQFNQASEATTRYVQDQPGKSLLLAAAAGAAFATLCVLTSRRRAY